MPDKATGWTDDPITQVRNMLKFVDPDQKVIPSHMQMHHIRAMMEYIDSHTLIESRTGENFREVGKTPHGYTIFAEDNGVGGRTYWSDEIGGGVMIWDTCLVARESLETAFQIETPTAAAVKDEGGLCCGATLANDIWTCDECNAEWSIDRPWTSKCADRKK